jgi:NAD(P)H-hydrate epimerase
MRTPVILTPHPGEMTRLSNSQVGESTNSRIKIATEFAKKYKVIITLKGYRTIVTDGTLVYINQTGNPGMATGGSGDVLTGIISALLGQKLKPFDAAQLGVYLHGLAGDLAARQIGQVSMIASDILDYLPKAFAKLYSTLI